MTIKDYLDIAIGIFTVIGFIYKLASMEAEISTAIDKVKDSSWEKLTFLEQDLKIHLALCKEKEENNEYLLSNLDKKIDHKFNRIYQEIKTKNHDE